MAETNTLARNRLLAMLSDEERARLAPELETLSLELKHHVYREKEPIEHVYFPLTGVVSLISYMEDGRGIEVATIGNEGMVGLPVFLQASVTSAHRASHRFQGSRCACRRRASPRSSRPRTTAASIGPCTATPKR